MNLNFIQNDKGPGYFKHKGPGYFKKDKDALSLNNWRPISLPNVDYKIASKAIANKIKTKLPAIISPDHTGFIKGRYIGDNICILHETIEYINNLNEKGLIFFSDVNKAFDSLDHNFIKHVYGNLNFQII